MASATHSIQGHRALVETAIELLITYLDAIDGDENLEPSLAGWDSRHMHDLEDVCEDEGNQCEDEGAIDYDPPGRIWGGQGL